MSSPHSLLYIYQVYCVCVRHSGFSLFSSVWCLMNMTEVCVCVCARACVYVSQVVAAYGALPFPMAQGNSLPDTLGDLLWKPLSACPEQAMIDRSCTQAAQGFRVAESG